MQAWETPTGIPYNTLNLRTGLGKNPSWTMRGSTLSEYGTEQMELITLTALTGNATYGNRAEHVIRLLHQNFPEKVSPQYAIQMNWVVAGKHRPLQMFLLVMSNHFMSSSDAKHDFHLQYLPSKLAGLLRAEQHVCSRTSIISRLA